MPPTTKRLGDCYEEYLNQWPMDEDEGCYETEGLLRRPTVDKPANTVLFTEGPQTAQGIDVNSQADFAEAGPAWGVSWVVVGLDDQLGTPIFYVGGRLYDDTFPGNNSRTSIHRFKTAAFFKQPGLWRPDKMDSVWDEVTVGGVALRDLGSGRQFDKDSSELVSKIVDVCKKHAR